MRRMWRLFAKGVLAMMAIVIVASTVYLPGARLPVVIWLLSVALIWRPLPGSEQ